MIQMIKNWAYLYKVSRLTPPQRGLELFKAFKQAEKGWLEMIAETNSHDVAQFVQNVQKRHPQLHITDKPTWFVRAKQKIAPSLQAMAWRNHLTGTSKVYFPPQSKLDPNQVAAHEFLHVFQHWNPLLLGTEKGLLLTSLKEMFFHTGKALSLLKLPRHMRRQAIDKHMEEFFYSHQYFKIKKWASLKEQHAHRTCLKHGIQITKPDNVQAMADFNRKAIDHYKEQVTQLQQKIRQKQSGATSQA